MAELGISDWTNIPNTNLEHWMRTDSFPSWFRVMCTIVRHSYGYQSAHCIRMQRDPKTDQVRAVAMKQVDIGEVLGLCKQRVNKAIQELEADGSVRTEGQMIFMCHNPQPRLGEEQEKPHFAEEPDTPVQRFEKVLKTCYFQLRKVLKERYFPAGKVTPFDGAYKEESFNFLKGESESEWVGRLVSVILRELELPAEDLPADPTPSPENKKLKTLEAELEARDRRIAELETELAQRKEKPSPIPTQGDMQELCAYLDFFRRTVKNAPLTKKLVRQVHERLRGAPVEQLRTRVEQRRQSGLEIKSWGIFLSLADDCAGTREQWQQQETEVATAAARADDFERERRDSDLEAARRMLQHPDCTEEERELAFRTFPELEAEFAGGVR
jgi:hypothetical protein